MKILKYKLAVTDVQSITLRKGARPLSLANQTLSGNDSVVLYVIESDVAEKEIRTVRMFGTGHEFDAFVIDDYTFLGTVIVDNGKLMWHVFISNVEEKRRARRVQV